MPRFCDCATPLNWTMTAWSSLSTSTTKQNGIYQIFRMRFNQRWLQFLFGYSFSNWLAVSCFFPFEQKAYVNLLKSVSVCKRHFWWRQIWRHLHVTVLQCWAKFSNGLVYAVWGWFVPKSTKLCLNLSTNTVASFFPGHGVYLMDIGLLPCFMTDVSSKSVWQFTAKQKHDKFSI